jgi:hypothetical protein
MDGASFDALSRRLSTLGSRRHVLGAILASSAAIGMRPAEPAGAKKKKKITLCHAGQTIKASKKKKKTHLKHGDTLGPCVTCPDGQRPCRGACLSNLICCDDGDCAGGRTCQQGTCACPANKPHICPGNTICQECCQTAHCFPALPFDGRVCQNGQCVCGDPGTRLCTGEGAPWAGACGACCDDSECSEGRSCTVLTGESPSCRCPSDSECSGVCIPFDCRDECLQPCTTAGASCCGNGALVCTQVTANQRFCLPPG